MNPPTQCSDQGDPTYQTGQEVEVTALLARAQAPPPNQAPPTAQAPPPAQAQPPAQAPPPAPDLQPDAEQYDARRGRCPPPSSPPTGAGAGGVTSIVIEGSGGTSIKATGLVEALKPGVNFQLAHTIINTQYKGSSDPMHYGNDGAAGNTPNQHPITNNPNVPEDCHLRVVSEGIAQNWKRLGRQLGLSDAALAQIRMDNHLDGQIEVNYQVLRKWMETVFPVSVHLLAKALADIGRGDLADKLSGMN